MDILENIEREARSLIDTDAIFVVSVEEKGHDKFVVFVDGRSGVTIENCGKWNKALRQKIEGLSERYAEGNFELEVSSYGIGKPLIDERQYDINLGRKVVVLYVDDKKNEHTIEGVLTGVLPAEIIIDVKKKKLTETTRVDKKNIKKIYIDVTF